MAKRQSKRTKEFCNRVAELMRADPITGRANGHQDVGEIIVAIGGPANVKAWLAHTRQVTADAIQQAIREMGLPPELTKRDIDV